MKSKSWIKRLLFYIGTMGLPWGCSMLIFMNVYFTLRFCGFQCVPDDFLLLFANKVSKTWVLWMTGGLVFGLSVWIGMEIHKKFILPKEKDLAIDGNEIDLTTGINVIHVPQNYPPTRWVGKTKAAMPFIVVLDGQHIASFSQLSSIQIPLEPGTYELFVGFENNSSWWKRGCRSSIHKINLEKDKVQTFILKWDSRTMFRGQVFALVGCILLVTEPLWLYPLLDLLPDSIWKSSPLIVQLIKILLIIHPAGLSLIVYSMFLFFRGQYKAGSMLLLQSQDTPD